MKHTLPILITWLLLSARASAAVVYTDFPDLVLTTSNQSGQTVIMNGDAINFTGHFTDHFIVYKESNPAFIKMMDFFDAEGLDEGDIVGNAGAWDFSAQLNGDHYEFTLNTDKFIGVRLYSGKYGWIRVEFTSNSMIIKDLAYENVSGTPITISLPVTTNYYIDITVPSPGTVQAYQSAQLQVLVHPVEVISPNVVWSITNGPGQAEINASGLLTGISPGYVLVTATPNFNAQPYTKAILIKPGSVGIEETGLSDITLYPNPAAQTIQLSGLTGASDLSFVSADGKLCLFVPAASGDPIDISMFEPGIYYVIISGVSGSSALKLVKE